MTDNKKIFRILDVNINRVKEGLRVCEDITRFILNDPASTKSLKSLRHKIEDTIAKSSIRKKLLCESRDVKRDCATEICYLEHKKNWRAIFFANIQRTKEALRVLEEFSKLFEEKMSKNFKNLRFNIYEQEKNLTRKYFK